MTNEFPGTFFRDEPEQDPDARTDEIVAEIDHTRDQMSETVQAIGEKLDPGNIARDASETVKAATVGKVEQMATGAQETWRDVTRGETSGIVDTITGNPIPAGMVAVGLAMLFMKRGASSQGRMRGEVYANTPYGTPDYRSPTGTWQQGASTSGGGSTAGKLGSSVSDAAGQAGSRVSAVADQAGERVGRVAEDVAETASQAQHEAQRLVSRGTSQFRRLMDDSPLAVGAAALAAGAAAGMLIPSTDQERRTIGPARDRLVDEAEMAAHETLDTVEDRMESSADA